MGGGIGVGGLNKIEWHKVAGSFSCIIGKKSKHLYCMPKVFASATTKLTDTQAAGSPCCPAQTFSASCYMQSVVVCFFLLPYSPLLVRTLAKKTPWRKMVGWVRGMATKKIMRRRKWESKMAVYQRTTRVSSQPPVRFVSQASPVCLHTTGSQPRTRIRFSSGISHELQPRFLPPNLPYSPTVPQVWSSSETP